ncbi:MAG: hypothetical protein PHS57_09240 [Alphaproteobacteria bacterium]|nr:hypothetical protein [Alphaproteobacteria bacterium]
MMRPSRYVSLEEDIAYELAELAVLLHKRGFLESYQHLVRARDCLLVVLDNDALSLIKGNPIPTYEQQGYVPV